MQDSILIAQEISRYLGLKNKHSLRKKGLIYFAFGLYKNVSQKRLFLYKRK